MRNGATTYGPLQESRRLPLAQTHRMNTPLANGVQYMAAAPLASNGMRDSAASSPILPAGGFSGHPSSDAAGHMNATVEGHGTRPDHEHRHRHQRRQPYHHTQQQAPVQETPGYPPAWQPVPPSTLPYDRPQNGDGYQSWGGATAEPPQIYTPSVEVLSRPPQHTPWSMANAEQVAFPSNGGSNSAERRGGSSQAVPQGPYPVYAPAQPSPQEPSATWYPPTEATQNGYPVAWKQTASHNSATPYSAQGNAAAAPLQPYPPPQPAQQQWAPPSQAPPYTNAGQLGWAGGVAQGEPPVRMAEAPVEAVPMEHAEEEEPKSFSLTDPLPLVYHDAQREGCECPNCRLLMHIASVFADQRRSSAKVLARWPSPVYAGTEGYLPPLTPLPRPWLKRCPVFDAFGFCPYSDACFLDHVRVPTAKYAVPAAEPLVKRLKSAEAEVERLAQKAAEHRSTDRWSCDVCGLQNSIDDQCMTVVGFIYYHRSCPRCGFHCYLPHITYLVEHLVARSGDDYQLYKTLVEKYRGMVPDEYRVPLSYEAHRVGSILFAWSLVSPAQIRDAIDAVNRRNPSLKRVVSAGSGAGYIEHVFNRVMNSTVTVPSPNGPPQRQLSVSPSPSSFDGVHTSFFGKKQIEIIAFDQIATHFTYSVHVSLGGPFLVASSPTENTVLLLCWPPFGSAEREESSMGYEALENFTQHGGRFVIYIGDRSTTGDWRFHELLYTHFKLIPEYPVRREVRRWAPAEMGFVYSGNDEIGVYERRPQPIPLPPYWTYNM